MVWIVEMVVCLEREKGWMNAGGRPGTADKLDVFFSTLNVYLSYPTNPNEVQLIVQVPSMLIMRIIGLYFSFGCIGYHPRICGFLFAVVDQGRDQKLKRKICG